MHSSSAQNPYEILGVTPGCSPEALRKAYLHKARECHPDRNPNDPQATLKFQQLSHAYDILQSQSSTSTPEFDRQAYEHVFECMTVDEYKAMFEKLSQKAVTFYNNHQEEIQLAKSLWSSFKSKLTHLTKEDNSHVVDTDKEEDDVFSEDEDEDEDEDENDEDENEDVHVEKPSPLIFTIRVSDTARKNKEFHKVEYVRYRWHPERKHLDEESCALLVPVEHEEVTFPGEGDCYAKSRVAGDVIVFVTTIP